jgi:hypothetical protein
LLILVLFSAGSHEVPDASEDCQIIESCNTSASDAMPLVMQEMEESQVEGWNIWQRLGLPSASPLNEAVEVKENTKENDKGTRWWELSEGFIPI